MALKVLVTGAGSGVGQGIIKALRLSSLSPNVVVADIGLANQGLYRGDDAVIIPKVEEDGALKKMTAILKAVKPDAVLIGSEFETAFFARHREELESTCRTHICAAPGDSIAIANDKWLTFSFLKEHDLSRAHSLLSADGHPPVDAVAAEIGYPCVLKTRTGTSNRHVHILRTAEDLIQWWPTVPMPVVQKLIAEPSSSLGAEYTCSVFRCADGTLMGPFTARRTLRGGNSWLVEVDHFTGLHQLLLDIGTCMPFSGSLNVQLMQTEDGPIPFEFNLRFSGTTAVRAHFGFNEPEMYLRSYIMGEPIEPPTIRRGMALRYLEEVFVDGVVFNEINPTAIPKGMVRPWF